MLLPALLGFIDEYGILLLVLTASRSLSLFTYPLGFAVAQGYAVSPAEPAEGDGESRKHSIPNVYTSHTVTYS